MTVQSKSPGTGKMQVLVGTCALIIIFAAVAGAASASKSTRDLTSAARNKLEAQITVPGTHGFRIEIKVSAAKAELMASKGHVANFYSTEHSAVRHGVFWARFGGLGEVSLRFVASRRGDRTNGGGCSVQPGKFYGQISFRGESKFTQLRRKAARGAVLIGGVSDPESDCHAGRPAQGPPMPRPEGGESELRSVIFRRDGFVRFYAGPHAVDQIQGWETGVGIPLGLPLIEKRPQAFSALSIETRNTGLRIVRLAAAGGPLKTFMATPDNVLTLTPPAPFFGTGQMEVCRPGSWEGTLKVVFPGKEVVLAGHQSAAAISPPSSSC
jgi:hypothetical protein